ncbi:MAG: type II toxin-antitoxin system RatA family toxin [Alphaproteobacteria bacterium]|jgi:coenzyme Q-binding protein COQ10|nr:type II toxin-antitoxin system RatA family toxin [Alphaproteobacteria bacterium]MDP6587881.1 type II toxin-antitoxin system RatA family toxin [Alphaproteobacteria bacterium]MDP6817624.1 type II toxin-antitoxin system RatA family toxin [Alphaproteobacteria bacterium]
MPKHKEKRVLNHSPQQMFEIVADVESYPQFLPWCLGTRVTKQENDSLEADMLIGFRMFRERFGSHVELDRVNKEIDVRYTHGPFRYLFNNWRFLPHADGCEIDFSVDFEFRSRLLQKIMGALFTEAVHRMVSAFETRAREIYGSAAAEPRQDPAVPAD